MLDKFSDLARKVMTLAGTEAKRRDSEFISTEHILLAIIQEDCHGVAAMVLKGLNVNLKRIRQEIEKLISPSTPPTVIPEKLPLSPRAKHVIELAGEAASGLGHGVIGTEHLLLGLLNENEGIAAQVLINLGLKLDQVRDMVLEVLGQNVAEHENRNTSTMDQATAMMEKMHQRSLETGPERARQKLDEIQKRISQATPSPCSMRVWLFKDKPSPFVNKAVLAFQDAKLFESDVVQVEGVPFDKRESIAASIAKECGALAYLIEPYYAIREMK